MFGRRGVQIKSPEQVAAMRSAGLVVGQTLATLTEAVHAGMTTGDLDVLAEDCIRSSGATPSFKGYQGFPASICTSVNDQVVHGIPGQRVLRDGDLVSIDCGAIVDGWHGDAAVTVAVGAASAADQALMDTCRQAMWRGIAAARVGGRVTDISSAVERHVRSCGPYGIVEDYVGHGVGTELHQQPSVPNHGRPGRGSRLVAGIVLAVEPMVTVGSQATRELDDRWTVETLDGSRSAHFEHTFALTERGHWVLTALDGGEAMLSSLGLRCGAPRGVA